jgi:KDO2-lipid IV(A) lauroyltransferase
MTLLRQAIARLRRVPGAVSEWLIGQSALVVIRSLRHLPMEKALNFADRFARRFGPLAGRHAWRSTICVRLSPRNRGEIQQIASDMWGHMARLAGEYLFLDQIFDFDPKTKHGERIEVDGEPYFLRIAAEQRPHIIFTGHLGNFELLPVAGLTFGMPVTSMFRPPNNRYIANYIYSTCTKSMGGLLASRSGAAFELARLLEAGSNIGVLVDQKFTNGVPTTFSVAPARQALCCRNWCASSNATSIRRAANASPAHASGYTWRKSSSFRVRRMARWTLWPRHSF